MWIMRVSLINKANNSRRDLHIMTSGTRSQIGIANIAIQTPMKIGQCWHRGPEKKVKNPPKFLPLSYSVLMQWTNIIDKFLCNQNELSFVNSTFFYLRENMNSTGGSTASYILGILHFHLSPGGEKHLTMKILKNLMGKLDD